MYSANEIKMALRKYVASTGDASIDEQRIIEILDMGSDRDFNSISDDIYKIRQEFGVKRSIPEWMRMLTFRLVYDAMVLDENAKQEELLKALGFNKKVFDGTSWQMYSPDMKLRQSIFNPVNFPFSYAEVESNPIYVAMLHHLVSEARIVTNTFVDVFGKMGYVPAFCVNGYAHKLIFTDNYNSYMNYYRGITERPTRAYKVLQEYMDKIEDGLGEKLNRDDRDEKIRAIVSDSGLARNLYSSNLNNHAAAKFTYMCFQKPYWENRNVDYDSEEKFIIDDFSSIKKAKAFLDISKEDFVAYAQALKKVEYKDTSSNLMSVFVKHLNELDTCISFYQDYDYNGELAKDLKNLVGDEKPLLYVDAPKMGEEERFGFDSEKYMSVVESLLYYDGDWILTFKNYKFEDKESNKQKNKILERLKESERPLYIFKYDTQDTNIRNGISFITTIDFETITKQKFEKKYNMKLTHDEKFIKRKVK